MQKYISTSTAQGGDTPVPVGAGSERTGSPRPSASDCSRQSNEELVDPFKRRDSLPRTPTKNRHNNKDNPRSKEGPPHTEDRIGKRVEMEAGTIGTPVNSDEESDCVFIDKNKTLGATSKKNKRKRIGTPEKKEDPDKELLELRSIVEKLVVSSKRMKSLIEAIPNTKSDLKKEVARSGYQVEILDAKCKEWNMYPGRQAARVTMGNVTESGCQTETMISGPAYRSVGTQVTEEDIESGEKIRDEAIRILGEGRTLDEINSILDKQWPEEVYKSVKMEQGNPLQVENDCDLILILKNDTENDKGLLKGMIAKYPEIDEIIGQGMKRDQLDYIENVTRSVTSRRGVEETKKYIYLLPYEGEAGDVEDRRSLHRLLMQMREIIRKSGRKKFAMASQEGLDRDHIRKMAEYTLGKMDLQVRYLTSRGGARNLKRAVNKNEDEKILVKGETTYADLLKRIKKDVDLKGTGAEIKNIKRTADGNLLFIVQGGAAKANALRNEIRNKVQGVTVHEKKAGHTCIITGIDEVTTKEEIIEEIKIKTKLKEADIKILSLRLGKNGNQTAIVELPKPEAINLLRAGKICIGWLTCGIAEKVELTRCYRCLEFGHRSRTCNNADRRLACLKCGKEGHKAKECTNTPWCTTCQKGNHRADQMSCPAFKKQIEIRRKRLASQRV